MKLLSTTCLLRKNCQSNKDGKWKQMFFLPKGLRGMASESHVCFLSNCTNWLSCPPWQPLACFLDPCGFTCSESRHGSGGRQQALKTEEGLGLSVSAQLRAIGPFLPPTQHPPKQAWEPLLGRQERARAFYSLTEFIFPFWGRAARSNTSEMGRVLGTQAPPPPFSSWPPPLRLCF